MTGWLQIRLGAASLVARSPQLACGQTWRGFLEGWRMGCGLCLLLGRYENYVQLIPDGFSGFLAKF